MKNDLEQKLEADSTNYEKTIKDLKEELDDVKERLVFTSEKMEREEIRAKQLTEKMADIDEEKEVSDKELNELRAERSALAKEREVLINDVRGHQVEIETMYNTNKELKTRIKRYEKILYGRNKKTI